MASSRQNVIHSTRSTTRQLFSGPDGQRDHIKTILHPGYVGETSRNDSEPITSDVRHLINDAKTNPHPKSKAGWVGVIGWEAAKYNDEQLLKSGHQMRSTGMRGVAIWKLECHPKLL